MKNRCFVNNNKGQLMISSTILAVIIATSIFSSSKLEENNIINDNAVYNDANISTQDDIYKNALELKLDLIRNEFLKNNELNNIKADSFFVFDSVSDGKNQAITCYSSGEEFDKAFEKSKRDISYFVSNKTIEPLWVKVDVIDNMSTDTSLKNLKPLIFKSAAGSFDKGIIFELSGEIVAITNPELNANLIIDYDNDSLRIDALNLYLGTRGYKKLEKLPNNFKLFTTISYFCDENNSVYQLYKNEMGVERRNIKELPSNEAKKIVESASDYLVSQIKEDGTFVYGYHATKDKMLTGYNNVRHAGTLWALINCYDKGASNSKEYKKAIDKATYYLTNNISKKSDNIYHMSYSNNKLSLGMDGLSLVALSEYTNKFGDNTYLDICKKIGNGIIDLQQEDGHFVHILKDQTYEVEKEFSTVYYDGEAILGLCKLYGLSRDEKYLDAAKKAFDYCIENNYLTYDDHWLEYSANEITKYTTEEKYYTFGLKNIVQGLDTIKDKKSTSHTDFEKLMQGYELYKRIIEKKINVDYLKEFPSNNFIDTIKTRSVYQLNSFCYPEMVMYLKNPSRYLGAFYIRKNDYRVRIDDVQHSMTGYYYYSKNF